jgi:hypothetical protein
MEELKHCQAVLEEAAANNRPFRFLIVPWSVWLPLRCLGRSVFPRDYAPLKGMSVRACGVKWPAVSIWR